MNLVFSDIFKKNLVFQRVFKEIVQIVSYFYSFIFFIGNLWDEQEQIYKKIVKLVSFSDTR